MRRPLRPYHCLISLLLLLLTATGTLAARQVTLQWDPNSEPDLSGYRVFCRTTGQSFDYSQPTWEGATAYCSIGDLSETADYFFVVRAFDTEGLESDDSVEVHLPAAVGTPQRFNLAVNATPTGQVTLSPAGGTYDAGSPVSLRAVAPDGWAFVRWSGAVSGTANPVTVVMNGNKIATATFEQRTIPEYSLATNVNGQGTVAKTPSAASYASGTSVRLTAAPAAGWEFVGWSGAVGGSATPATLLMDGNKIVTATFAQTASPQYNLAVARQGEGTVSLNPAGGTYDEGTSVSLSAAPAAGWTFAGWVGAVNGSRNPATVNMTGHKVVTASFVRANIGPTANAGFNQNVQEGKTVLLNGSQSSDTDDGIAAYKWTQTFGTPVKLSSSTSQKPTFPAPDVGMGGEKLIFRLTVTDRGGLQDSDDCAVNISWVNTAPVANAGPDQKVGEGETVTLSGSGSTDVDDGIATYRWVQTNGPAVTLSDGNSANPTFDAPDVGPGGTSLVFELTVKDLNGLVGKDTCVVNTTWQNEPPQADAGGDQTVAEGARVVLDGTGSLDIDDGMAGYRWRQVSGTPVSLSNSTAGRPAFTAPDVGQKGDSLQFELTVTDTEGLMDTDTCTVNVSWQNEPPTAVVAEDYIETEPGTMVELDGSHSSDPDDGIQSFHWIQVEGKPVDLKDAGTQTARFLAPDSDAYGSNLVFKLTVADRAGLRSSATGSVFVTAPPAPETQGLDLVTIQSVEVVEKGLLVIAVSNAPQDTVKLTVHADYGDRNVKLGNLRYWWKNDYHRQKFTRAQRVLPDSLTVTSSGGGSATWSRNGSVSSGSEAGSPQLPDTGPASPDGDTIQIDNLIFSDRGLVVIATSDAPEDSVRLTAWANYGSRSVKLGNLRYWWNSDYHRQKFTEKVNVMPDSVTVTSTGGGSATGFFDNPASPVSVGIGINNLTGDGEPEAADTVAIQFVKHSERGLVIIASSDAPEDSARLTAYADYGQGSVKLGNLRYWWNSDYHRQKFTEGVEQMPDSVTVVSSQGGSATTQDITTE